MADSDSPNDRSEPEPSPEGQRQHRRDALSALARQQQSAAGGPSAMPAPDARVGGGTRPPGATAPRSRRHWLLGGVAIVLALVVVAGLVLRFALPTHPTTHSRQPAKTTTIVPLLDHLGCPVDVAWSPDATRVALLGYTACSSGFSPSGTNPGRIMIYNTTTGQLVQQIAPDQLILQATHINLPPPLTASPSPAAGQPVPPYIRYQALLWSPDGKHLALPFFIEWYLHTQVPPFIPAFRNTVPPTNTTAGVLVTDTTGGNAEAITADYRETAGVTSLEWSLSGHTLLSSALNLEPALAYQWGANGQLLPQTPLGTSAPPAPPSGPIGDADGGASFTLWQPGEAAPAYAQSAAHTPITSVPDVYLWYTDFAAWSPDGQYLITPNYVGGRIVVPEQPTPTASALAASGLSTAALLPERDGALRTLYAGMAGNAGGEPASAQCVAWRPDGRIAAATAEPYFGQTASQQAQSHPAVVLYDSATGHRLATLAPKTALADTLTNPLSLQPVWLKWSPDGSHLLLLDLAIGTLTIWGPGTLLH